MRLTLAVLAGLAGLTMATPQIPTPPSPPPNLPPPSGEPIPNPPPSPPGPDPPQLPSTVLHPTETGEPGQGPVCKCGYTYCAEVLMSMKVPWPEQRLAEAYCTTPNVACANGNIPPTNATEGLFICLCKDEETKMGTDLDLLCGCDSCLVVKPDYRGRCKTPCTSASCFKKSEGGGGGLLIGDALE